MAIHYHCRHCGVEIGAINDVLIHSKDIGLHTLTEEERRDMIRYEADGHVTIKTICEDCHEALNRNPDLHQYDYFIH